MEKIYTPWRGFREMLEVMVKEAKHTFKDEGVLMFFFLVPIMYPILYGIIYMGQYEREVPVAVVDLSHSDKSREFIRLYDASPDVQVAYYCNNLEEAKSLMGKQQVRGVIYLPSDFQTKLFRKEQTVVSVYTDMSIMLDYKAVYQPTVAVASAIGHPLQVKGSQSFTERDEELSTEPVKVEEVPIFVSTGGYADFIFPGVMLLIIQQTMLLGVGMAAGTARERRQPFAPRTYNVLSTVLGKAAFYFTTYLLMSTITMVLIPRMFGFLQLLDFKSYVLFLVPFLLSSVFFSMVFSVGVRYREEVILLVVFTSVPFLFLSGISWPQSSIPIFWRGIGALIPSTFGIRGFVRLNSMQAELADIWPELRGLWLQAFVYFLITCALYSYQRIIARRNGSLERDAEGELEEFGGVREELEDITNTPTIQD